jgi:hypothetical protein
MDELNQLRDQLAASEAARQLSDEYWGKLSELLKNGGMDDPAFVYGQVKATVEMLSGAEVARQQAEQEPFCEFCQSTEPSPMQVCTKCWNSANNDTWQRRAISAEAEVSDLRAQIARLHELIAQAAVMLARAIVAEVERTEPKPAAAPPPDTQA